MCWYYYEKKSEIVPGNLPVSGAGPCPTDEKRAAFIDEAWKLKNYVLVTRPMHESHTGENIGSFLKETLAEWNLTKFGQIPVVTDNASNMDIAVARADMFPHVKCLAHTINLAAQKALGINAVSRLLGRIRRIVSFFHRSSTAAQLLKVKQSSLSLPVHKLMIDVSTRWNSAYDMVHRYLEQQPAIAATLLSNDIKKNVHQLDTLSNADIKLAEDLLQVLKVLKDVTTTLCDEKIPTVSMILPIQKAILSHVQQVCFIDLFIHIYFYTLT